MSKARLLQDYLIPGSAENENTVITNYWLEFVAARDEREQTIAAVNFTEAELHEKVREFQRQMNTVIRNNQSLRQALVADRLEHLSPVSSGVGKPSIPVMPWPLYADPLKDQTLGSLNDQIDDRRKECGFDEEQRPVQPNILGTLLQKILGK
jgi:hypothetical protein